MNAATRTPLNAGWPTHADGTPATLVAALARNAAQFGDRIGFRERKYGVWQEQTWRQVLEEVTAIAAGFDGYLTKPVNADRLFAELDRLPPRSAPR